MVTLTFSLWRGINRFCLNRVIICSDIIVVVFAIARALLKCFLIVCFHSVLSLFIGCPHKSDYDARILFPRSSALRDRFGRCKQNLFTLRSVPTNFGLTETNLRPSAFVLIIK